MGFDAERIPDGFRLVETRESAELGGRTLQMEHTRTGAKLFWVDNGEENMVFSVTFRTPPEDSTGVFHILEHSVLCGSRKYPVREPFVELLKSSMNTFLNAMTFPDMTMYPVSSRNPKDLMNLAEVYLDAVFDPLVMEDAKRFCQEGWHIDRDEEGNPEYRGVVFNEMKGSMSDVDAIIDHETQKLLFPDTCFGYNSGGDPEEIPDLTYERFREQYRKHYHPSNALFYLDGNVPMEEMLRLIASYLDRYGKREALPGFATQVPAGAEKTIYYELGQDETAENRGYLTLSRLTGTWKDRAENMARGIICDVLTGNNEAPLKRAALEKGLAQDLSLSVDDTVFQSWVTIHAENVTDGREQEILELLAEMGGRIRREGLDRSAVEASLNRAVFALRDEEEPQGIGRCIRCLGTWVYGGDPTKALESGWLVREVRGLLDTGAFDELAADMLLNRENLVTLHTLPSHTLGAEKRAQEEERLRKTTGAWSAEKRAANERLIVELEEWHTSEEDPERLALLPKLTLEDADVEPEWVETDARECLGVPVLVHTLNCNGVVHLRAYFRLTDYTLEELTALSQVTGLLGRLPTAEHDALKLQQEIRRWTGSLGFAVAVRSMPDQDETCTPCLVAYTSALEESLEQACGLIAEILTSTRFTDRDRMIEMFRQNELGARQRILGAGHLIGVKNVLSHYSADGAVKNALDGDRAVRYIHRLAKDPEKELPALLHLAGRMMRETFCRSRLTVSVTASKPVIPESLIACFPEGSTVPESAAYRSEGPMAVGYRIPAQTGFAVRGWRLSRIGQRFCGSLWLASSILSLDYLWNRVRVQGGAYGAGLQADRSGNIFTYSYRDPTPAKTLETDAGAADFLREFAREGGNLDQYIISALNELNPLLSARDKGAVADGRYMNRITREERDRLRQEVLHATGDDLVRCADWLEAFSREGAVCAVGHGEILEACRGLEISDL